jgi:putative FmdB family regulatory protein
MPLFEYNCEKCTYKFEKLVLSPGSEVKCPLCQNQVKKLYSSFAIGHSGVSSFNPTADFEPKICRNC